MSQVPYIKRRTITVEKMYNPAYGDDRMCKCGHRYESHFDSYDNMANVGCEFCFCTDFVESKSIQIKSLLEALDYWIDLSPCTCRSEYPIGACEFCDLTRVREYVKKGQADAELASYEANNKSEGDENENVDG